MALSRDDFTLDELLSDPVTLAMMRADRVDPSAMEVLWRGLARPGAVTPLRPGEPTFSLTRGGYGHESAAWHSESRPARDRSSHCFLTSKQVVSRLCGAL